MAELDDKVIVTKDKITTIADTIRQEGGTSDLMTLDEMPDNIRAIAGGGSADVKRLGITLANNTATFNLNGYEIWQLIGSNKTIVADITYTDGNNSTSYNKSCTASLKSEASDTQTRIEASVMIYKNYTFYTRYFNMVIGASSMEYTGTYAVTDIVIPEEQYVDPLFTLTYPSTITCNKTFAQISSYYGAGNTKPVAPQLIYKYSSGDNTAFRSVYGEVEQYDEDTFIFRFNMGYARGVGKTKWQDRIIEIKYASGNLLTKIDDYILEYQKPVVEGDGINITTQGTGINRKSQISVDSSMIMIGNASGSVASIVDGGDDMPMKSCVVEIDSTDGVSECNIANISDADKKEYFKGLLNGTYGFVDLGTLNWTYDGSRFYVSFNIAEPTEDKTSQNAISSMYMWSNSFGSGDNTFFISSGGYLSIWNSSYTDATTFKTAMNGVYLIYELATPTTPSITPTQFNTLLTAFGLDGWIYKINFVDGSTPLTVHDGELDVVTGVLTVNDTTPSTTYQLTPTEVKTLLGINNIFADTGDVENVEYIRDATSIINWLISQINLGA